MSRRLLTYDEWTRLDGPVKACFGADKQVPPPEIAPMCAIEEDENGQIIGFLFFQLCAHLEPFGSLGGASFSGLKGVIDEALTGIPNIVYYLHTDSPQGVDVYESNGFTVKGIMLEGHPE